MKQDLSCLLRLILVAAAGYVVGLSPETIQAEEQSATEAKKVVAEVNGKPIYEEQLKPEVESGLRKFRKYGMRKETPELVKRLQRKALDKLIDRELIHQESQKLATEGIDEKVEEKINALKTKHGKGKRFEKYLQLRGLTADEFRESLKARVVVDEYLKKQGILEPEIPEQRIREAYESSPESYSREETIRVSHILIAVHEPEEKEQARQKAEKIRREILDGKDFAEMAKEHSECNSASGGGSLGYIKRDYMPKEFDTVAFAMEMNAVSEVVESKFGYHIIRVSDKKAAGVIRYDEVREFIEKFLQEKESEVRLAAHLAELKEEAKIEILLND